MPGVTVVTDVLEAMAAAERVGQVVTRLKKLYDVTDAEIAVAIGLANPQAVQARRAGKHRFTWPEVVGLSRFFDLPTEVFSMAPIDALEYARANGRPTREWWAARDSNPEPAGSMPSRQRDLVAA